MIGRLIAWSARNLVLIFIGAAFLVAAGVSALRTLPLDALPDLSDVQVIVYTEYPGQAPQVVEDQVTYPLTTAMLAVPRSQVVRGFSFFGVSFVYVIFEDGTDIYWARSRVLEYLSAAAGRLPPGVAPGSRSGCDRRRLGLSICGRRQADDARRAALAAGLDHALWPGQGGRGGRGGQRRRLRQAIQCRRRPEPLASARHSACRKCGTRSAPAIRDVGGRTVEMAEFEFMVRGRGYLRGESDIETIVLRNDNGTPLLLKDVARVETGPDERRGVTELNGEGEVAGGIALQRYGANALDVIDNVKATLKQLASGLPKGVKIIPVYDRSQLIMPRSRR